MLAVGSSQSSEIISDYEKYRLEFANSGRRAGIFFQFGPARIPGSSGYPKSACCQERLTILATGREGAFPPLIVGHCQTSFKTT